MSKNIPNTNSSSVQNLQPQSEEQKVQDNKVIEELVARTNDILGKAHDALEEERKLETTENKEPRTNKTLKLVSLIRNEKVSLDNKQLVREANVLGHTVDKDAINTLEMQTLLFKDLYYQLKLFIFDYNETDQILAEMKENKGLNRTKVSKSTVATIGALLKDYYHKLVPNQDAINLDTRYFIPLSSEDKRVPFLVEVSVPKQSFTYLYFGEAPSDGETHNFVKELDTLLKDIFKQIVPQEKAGQIDACSIYTLGFDKMTDQSLKDFAKDRYTRVMAIVYSLTYENELVTKNLFNIVVEEEKVSRVLITLAYAIAKEK